MDEAAVRGQGHNLFARVYRWPVSQTDAVVCEACRHVNRPPKDRPDQYVMHPAKGAVFVEYKIYTVSKKTGKREKSFPFRNITSGQRTQLTIWVREGGLAYLALGTGYGRTNSRDDRRYLWLVPWREWLKLELKVRAHQDSLPLDFARQRPRTVAVREAGFDAVTQLKPFELVWEDGGWHLPPNHPLHVDEERDTKAFSAIWTRVRRYAEEENIEALLNEIKPD